MPHLITRVPRAAVLSVLALAAASCAREPAPEPAKVPPVTAAAATAPKLAVSTPEPGVKVEALDVVTAAGPVRFQVEIADDPAEREQGLMNRRSMPEDRGMLFDFFVEQPVAFWMRNTYIPLDMIFITADGRIFSIAKNTTPLSEAQVPAGGNVRAVLEINGGLSDRLGIVPGDRVRHRIFPSL